MATKPMNLTLKSCLYSSLILHLLIFVFISFITSDGGLHKPFVVFGAYSKKQYHTLYKNNQPKKASKTAVPFIGSGGRGRRHGGVSSSNRRSGGKASAGKVRSNRESKKINSTKSKFNDLKRSGAKNSPSKKTIKRKAMKGSKSVDDSSQNKSSKDSSIISEKSATNKKRLAEKLKNRKIDELNQKRELDAMIEEKRQLAELDKLNKSIKKQIEKEQELRKVEAAAKKLADESKQFDDELKNKETSQEKLVENVEKDKVDEVDDSDDYNDNGFDSSATSSNIVLSLTGMVDPEMVMYQKYIQQEVERLWKPPLGVPKGTTCRITFLVDTKGQIKNFDIFKRSSVLIYDLSILRIAHLFKFNKKLWGKSFTVDFCQ